MSRLKIRIWCTSDFQAPCRQSQIPLGCLSMVATALGCSSPSGEPSCAAPVRIQRCWVGGGAAHPRCPALHSPAESADKLLRGRGSHKQRSGGGWQPSSAPAQLQQAGSLPEPVKQSHLCQGRKMQQARRGSLVCLEFHFSSSQPCLC